MILKYKKINNIKCIKILLSHNVSFLVSSHRSHHKIKAEMNFHCCYKKMKLYSDAGIISGYFSEELQIPDGFQHAVDLFFILMIILDLLK